MSFMVFIGLGPGSVAVTTDDPEGAATLYGGTISGGGLAYVFDLAAYTNFLGDGSGLSQVQVAPDGSVQKFSHQPAYILESIPVTWTNFRDEGMAFTDAETAQFFQDQYLMTQGKLDAPTLAPRQKSVLSSKNVVLDTLQPLRTIAL